MSISGIGGPNPNWRPAAIDKTQPVGSFRATLAPSPDVSPSGDASSPAIADSPSAETGLPLPPLSSNRFSTEAFAQAASVLTEPQPVGEVPPVSGATESGASIHTTPTEEEKAEIILDVLSTLADTETFLKGSGVALVERHGEMVYSSRSEGNSAGIKSA